MKALSVIATWLICCNIAYGSLGDSTANYRSTLFVIAPSSPITYRSFIADLRELLKGEKTSHYIPLLPIKIPVSSNERFVLVQLAIGRMAPLITLAFDRTTSEIVSYAVQNQISYFFMDVSDEIYESPLFNSTIKNKLPSPYITCFDGYLSALRFETELGNEALLEAYDQLISYSWDTSTEIARSFVVVFQMIMDAARSTYVENMVSKNYRSGFLPVIDLFVNADSWSKLSNGVWKSVNGSLPETVLLYDEEGVPYVPKTVDEIKSKMGFILGKTIYGWCGYPVLQFSSHISKIVSF